MASINKVIIVGNLGTDPETRTTPNGDALTRISVATSESWKDQSGQKQEKTEWHRITFFRKLAEIAGQYLKKGSQVYIEGKLQTRKYTGNDGIERYQTDIIANELQMLGSRNDGNSNQNQSQNYNRQPQQNSYSRAKDGYSQAPQEFYDDVVPF